MSKFNLNDKVRVKQDVFDNAHFLAKYRGQIGYVVGASNRNVFDQRVKFKDGEIVHFHEKELEKVEDKPKFDVGDVVIADFDVDAFPHLSEFNGKRGVVTEVKPEVDDFNITVDHSEYMTKDIPYYLDYAADELKHVDTDKITCPNCQTVLFE